LGAGAVLAQDDAVKRTILQKTEVPGTPYVTVLGTAEIKAGATVGRHTHPGTESGYVVEGGGELLVQGQPLRHLQNARSHRKQALGMVQPPLAGSLYSASLTCAPQAAP
jgi:hypothetical protein